jgi:hypothetical protein
MKKNDAPVFMLTIVAIIVGVALYKLIDFKNLSVEKPVLASIYLITFLFSLFVIIKNRLKK